MISDSNISNDTGLSSLKNHQNQTELFLELFESRVFGENNICRRFGGVLTGEVHFKYDD